MNNKIHRLSFQLANQIAAGEVIERPASVVKEIVENSLDAGAKQISIDIEKGGTRLISIRDNGCGIDKHDLPLALDRHATSKIHELSDLASIHSLGFRGEALASIASVSKLTMTSMPVEQKTAWKIHLEGNDLDAVIEPASHPSGTTLEISELFYNTPARRKFLKSERTEYIHIEEIVKRIALSRFDVGFCLKHNQREIYNLKALTSPDGYEQRVAKICGTPFLKDSVRIEGEVTGLRLWGWLGSPSFARSQTDLQFFYINGRVIRDRLINHAIRQAYEGLIYEGRHPSYVLFLEIDPAAMDVNVHPTKHEVRFRESRWVHDFVASQVSHALLPTQSELPSNPLPLEHTAYKPLEISSFSEVKEPILSEVQHVEIVTKKEAPKASLGKYIGLFAERYLLVEDEQGLIVINPQRASQHVCAVKLINAINSKTVVSQPLLMPVNIKLSDTELRHIDEASDLLASLGMDVQMMGPGNVMVRKLPAEWRALDVEPAIQALVRFLSQKRNAEEVVGFLSEYILPKTTLSTQEIETLLCDLKTLSEYPKNIMTTVCLEALG